MFANKFYVGCDPEFAVLDRENNLLNVNNYFNLHGIENEDGNTFIGPRKIGWDHGGWVGEFRPNQQRSIYSLTRNLSALIKKAGLIFGTHKVLGGAHINIKNREEADRAICILGGHIHIDKLVKYRPEEPVRDRAGNLMYMATNDPIMEDIENLDKLTRLLEHVELLPKASCEQRRELSPYGKYGSYQLQHTPPTKISARWHQAYMTKQHDRYEYKTMCSWLFDPKVAYICLTGAKLVAVLGDQAGTILTGTSRKQLLKLFEVFAGKDRDADRILELLDLEKIEIRPDESFISKWNGWRL